MAEEFFYVVYYSPDGQVDFAPNLSVTIYQNI